MNLYLNFPQWQGSGKTNELYWGAKQICNKLNQYDWNEVPVKSEEELAIEKQILGYSTIKTQLSSAKDLLNEYKPDKVFTVGGGCDVEIIPVSYLNQKYNSNLIVLWIDAHGDLNTPESSPSKNFHGMPLRVLLGEGDDEITRLVTIPLSDSQVYLAASRDLDAPEIDFVQKHNITNINLANPTEVAEFIKNLGRKKLYIHLDLDAIDSEEYPFVKCPTARGLSLETVKNSLSILSDKTSLVGGSVVEYVPNENNDGLQIACDLFTRLVK